MSTALISQSLVPSGPATVPLSALVKRLTMSTSPRPAGEQAQRTDSGSERSLGIEQSPQTSVRRIDGPANAHEVAPRVAFYSHDTMGLGHLRRNLILAQSLAESSFAATSLLVAGAHEANFFALPPRVGLLTLPRLAKDGAGNYASGHLDLSVDRLVKLRADSIRSALDAFAPDLVVVDKVPTGAFGEMLPALRRLRKRFGTKCVLGVRDVLDEPEQVRREWANEATQQALEHLYDEIWVYGDQRVYDPAREYGWPANLAAKVRFTGYLDQASRLTNPRDVTGVGAKPNSSFDPLVVCSLGGGQDGYELAAAFIKSLPREGYRGVLVAGPFMPDQHVETLRRTSLSRRNLQFIRFTPDSDRLIKLADKVVTMGGYNSVCSVLSFDKPALVVPRIKPRREQWIRAERLAALDLVDVVHPDDLGGPSLARWIAADPPARRPAVATTISMDGLAHVGRLAWDLVAKTRGRRPVVAAAPNKVAP